MKPADVKIESSWKQLLKQEFQKPYFDNLVQKIKSEIKQGHCIYPPGKHIFNAFNMTDLDSAKVVLLGQDPYHREGQAMGLSFSVPRNIPIPASLRNIYKELSDDIGFNIPDHGDLTDWARQGVLMLNSILTVRKGHAGSHRNYGWEIFTDRVISLLSEKKQNLVFLLWGNYAKSKASLIDHNRHCILSAAHPSPLARGAFFGCKAFSKCNNYLHSHNLKTIQWKLN